MLRRLTTVTIGAAAILALGAAPASPHSNDTAAPPLTPAQLAEVRAVPAWDISYSETSAGSGSGSTSGTTSYGGIPTAYETTSSSTRSYAADAHLTVKNDGTGCAIGPGMPGCVADLSSPLHFSFSDQADSESMTRFK